MFELSTMLLFHPLCLTYTSTAVNKSVDSTSNNSHLTVPNNPGLFLLRLMSSRKFDFSNTEAPVLCSSKAISNAKPFFTLPFCLLNSEMKGHATGSSNTQRTQ